jgi:hypothetical protein
MADSDDLLTTVIEVAHSFEIDLRTVVVVNHQMTIDGIGSLEQREIAQTREKFAAEDPEVLDSLVRFQEWFYSDLRIAANHLALVGLITRFQHWIEKFTQELCITPTRNDDAALIGHLKALNRTLSQGPIPVAFFEDLITARDSVIHRDAKTQWTYKKKKRTVATHYCNGSKLEITEDQLKDAITKAIEQVMWYDEKIAPRRRRSSSSAVVSVHGSPE